MLVVVGMRVHDENKPNLRPTGLITGVEKEKKFGVIVGACGVAVEHTEQVTTMYEESRVGCSWEKQKTTKKACRIRSYVEDHRETSEFQTRVL